MAFYDKKETVSPLLSRMQKQEHLSLKNLGYHVPRVKQGKEASERLHSGENLPFDEKEKLWQKMQEGERSKEELTLMALPLVTTIAHKEHSRRSAWNSRVTIDDMVQEGMGGFLRGIEAYNVEGKQTSPTNYLGQWILSYIRRHVESLDHDFSIPHETMERYRKIRAIRSFLFNKLGRSPTDEEIIEHANDKDNQPKNKMGKVNKTASTKMLTLKQVVDEREFSQSTGSLESLAGSSDDDGGEYEKNSTSIYEEGASDSSSSHQGLEDQSARVAMGEFFDRIFKRIGMGEIQETIIRQKFGLPPYKDEIPLAGISQNAEVSKYKVNLVIEAFTKEMSSKNGLFHYEVSKLSYDELDSFNMGWVLNVLGEYQKQPQASVEPTLTQNMNPSPKKPRRSFGENNRPMQYNYEATYLCDDGHDTKIYLISERNKLRSKPKCYTCGGATEYSSIKHNPISDPDA